MSTEREQLDELFDLVEREELRIRNAWIAPAALGVTAIAVSALVPQALWASTLGQVAEPGHQGWLAVPAVLTALVLALARVLIGEGRFWPSVLTATGAGVAALIAWSGLDNQGEPGPGPWLALAGAGVVAASALRGFVQEVRRRSA